jgi:hypothetical protein
VAAPVRLFATSQPHLHPGILAGQMAIQKANTLSGFFARLCGTLRHNDGNITDLTPGRYYLFINSPADLRFTHPPPLHQRYPPSTADDT